MEFNSAFEGLMECLFVHYIYVQ